jgi:ribonucleotide monophosphatase NagD (HAD superfamily)
VIGEAGLTTALHDAGYTLTERNPDYVVLGETRTYSFERIEAHSETTAMIGDAWTPT